jgi:hypothetical protein
MVRLKKFSLQKLETMRRISFGNLAGSGDDGTPVTGFDVPESDVRPQLQQYKAERNCTAVTIQVIA